MKLLAANEAHPETAKLNSIPPVPFRLVKIPHKPSKSIGIKAYPTVLIMLYKGMISTYNNTIAYLWHKIK